ncbi:MAG: beta galactosidase jelly roll domain-containing protein [Chloroflexi bacterium]|nr:beta galactosidase jelly roll domain-containing protein [Chloroflexota bacterium]
MNKALGANRRADDAGMTGTPARHSAPDAGPISSQGNGAALSLDGMWRYCHTEDDERFARPAADDAAWSEMWLPNNWRLAGLDYAGVVWFRRRFRVPAAMRGRRVRLRFDGVDYLAKVYLNGALLGAHEGYFQPFEFDVTAGLLAGENVLAVRVDSPTEEWGKVWHMRKTLIKGIFGHHDCRPGGGWGPEGQALNTGGIWNSVTLHADPAARLTRVRVEPTLAPDHQSADLAVELTIENTRGRCAASVEVAVLPHNFTPGPDEPQEVRIAQNLPLAPGLNAERLSAALPRPRLWWTWDHGEPHLYRAEVTVRHDGEEDHRTVVFGVRTIEVADDWTWRLNGRRIFLRGSNYIPTQYLAEMDQTRFRRDVKLMQEANLNAIRVHAHVNREEFYRETDAAGILVWQDFALQWGYDDSAAFAEKAAGQMTEMIELLGQHPSIAVWCCHNETPWDAPWLQYKVPDYEPEQNKLLDRRLYEAATAADATRYVHLASGHGDGHPYPGWFHSKSYFDFADLPGQPFVTEYGAQALPSVENLRRMMSPRDLWPPDWEMWAFHDFQKMETFEIAGVRQGQSLEEFAANSQGYQARLIQFATECYRRAKWRPMTGLFHFMFVECWPSITWAVLDYWRAPKQGYDALRRAMQPVLPSIAYTNHELPAGKPFEFGLSVVNDLPHAFPNATMRWALVGRGRRPIEGEQRVDVDADSVTPVTPLRGEATLSPGDYCLEVRLVDSEGKLLGENELSFRLIGVAVAVGAGRR